MLEVNKSLDTQESAELKTLQETITSRGQAVWSQQRVLTPQIVREEAKQTLRRIFNPEEIAFLKQCLEDEISYYRVIITENDIEAEEANILLMKLQHLLTKLSA